jgi:flagellar protein FlaG
MSVPTISGSVQPAIQSITTASTTASQLKAQSVVASSGASPAPSPSTAELQQALDEVQAVIRPVAQDLLFSIDKDSGRTVVKVVDTSTDKVIRQFPSEELLAISKALDKFQGLLLKQQA